MPTSKWILANLSRIANDAWLLSFAWHVAAAATALAVLRGWRPTARTTALLLASLPASVSAVGFAYGNRFNGVSFGAMALLLAGVGWRFCSTTEAVSPASSWSKLVGALLVALGWFYPHFLYGFSLGIYAIAAPLGVIPCPTLAFAMGVTMLAGGLSRSWSVLLGVFGLAYGLFGVARLGVWLDAPVAMGAILLFVSRIDAGERVSRRSGQVPAT